MPEGSLRIGAVVDLEQLKSGFDESGNIVRETAESMGLSFQQLSSKIESVEGKRNPPASSIAPRDPSH